MRIPVTAAQASPGFTRARSDDCPGFLLCNLVANTALYSKGKFLGLRRRMLVPGLCPSTTSVTWSVITPTNESRQMMMPRTVLSPPPLPPWRPTFNLVHLLVCQRLLLLLPLSKEQRRVRGQSQDSWGLSGRAGRTWMPRDMTICSIQTHGPPPVRTQASHRLQATWGGTSPIGCRGERWLRNLSPPWMVNKKERNRQPALAGTSGACYWAR